MNKLHLSRRRISLQTFIPSVTLRLLFLVLVCHKTWLKSLAIHLWLISKLPFFIVPAANTTPLSFVLRPFSCQQSQIFISCFISGVINRFGRDLIFMRLTELCSHNVSTNNNLLTKYIKADSLAPWSHRRYLRYPYLFKKRRCCDHTHELCQLFRWNAWFSFPRLSKANLRCCLPQWHL